MPKFQNQPAKNAIHGRLQGISGAIAKSGKQKKRIKRLEKLIWNLRDRIDRHDKWEVRQEHRLRALEAAHRYHYWRQHPWLPRVLMYGITPSSLRFNNSEFAVKALRKAGYDKVSDVIDVKPSGGLQPYEIIHSLLVDEHRNDPDNMPEPPDPEEVEEFVIIAQQLIAPKSN